MVGDKKFCSPHMGTTFPVQLPRVPNSFPVPGSVDRVSLGKGEGKRFRSEKVSGLKPWVWKGLVPDWWQSPPPDAHINFFTVWWRVFRVLEVFPRLLWFLSSGFFELQVGIADVGAFSFLFRDRELLMRRSKFSATNTCSIRYSSD